MSDFSPSIKNSFREFELMELLHILRNALEVVVVHPVKQNFLTELIRSVLSDLIFTVSEVLPSLAVDH